MNKKIQELFDQALASSADQGAHLADFSEIFAKLIIDKCIEICNEVYENDHVDEYGDGPVVCAEEISDYFDLDN